ncbi:glycosyltransferase family 1 protein [Bacillus sp. A301a_S52]|nr:glycosyltransferase family 1 protein [Bacillus sp. A301a_S52]
MKKRILHVTGQMNRAGTETMLMNLYRQVHNEIQFDFISYNQNDGHYDDEIRQLGGNVIKLSHPSSIRELSKAIKKHGPYDAVHAHTLFHCGIANAAALIARVPVRVAHAHTTEEACHSFKKWLYMKSMKRLIKLFSTDFYACSERAATFLFGEKTIRQKNYTYFPNVIPYLHFLQRDKNEIAAFKKKWGIKSDIVIGHVGRFIEAKNHHFLLTLLAAIKRKGHSVSLLLIGEGDLKKDIEIKAKNMGLEEDVIFTGLLQDIRTPLYVMDCFVFPSRFEGLGLVLLEAQATGLPCVTSEAIQPEADIKLGLVERLSLTGSIDTWVERILEASAKRETDTTTIKSAFEAGEYNYKNAYIKLQNTYR